MKPRVASLFVLSLIIVSLSVGLGQAQGPGPQGPAATTFTYQGQLKQNGAPVSGTCDFRFSLWDAATDGAQVGATVSLDAVSVSKGLFTALLDFGAPAFDGNARWLGIEVRCPAGSGDHASLAPRQALTPTPYAMFAFAAPWGGLISVPAGLDDGDDDILATLTCAEGEIAKWDGAAWVCADDEGAGGIYTAGPGLVLAGSQFSVAFAGTGAATTAARSDHDHDAAYVNEGQPDSVDSAMIVDGTIRAADLLDGAGSGLDADLLDGHNSDFFQRRVQETCPAGFSIRAVNADGSVECEVVGGGGAWLLNGNAGTDLATHFLGTTDAVSLTLAVSGTGALRLEPRGTSPNVIGGHSRNSADLGVAGAAIGGGGFGGEPNCVVDSFGVIGGGFGNRAGDIAGATDALCATVAGGRTNYASNEYATVGGGWFNEAEGASAVVSGGFSNDASAAYATVSGGQFNGASSGWSTVGGGSGNDASGDLSTVAGGWDNTASGYLSSIGGGRGNEAQAAYATIAGGGPSDPEDLHTANRVFDNYGTVGGGGYNTAGSDDEDAESATYAIVAGGRANSSANDYATVGGGLANRANGIGSTVGGGGGDPDAWIWVGNYADGAFSTIGGGSANHAGKGLSTVGGGESNTASGYASSVGGGSGNKAWGDFATIAGGGPSDTEDPNTANHVYDDYGAIGGGADNRAGSNDGDSTYDTYATVGGGVHNTASARYATVAGGGDNVASAFWATVGGGDGNEAVENWATVGGGGGNEASGESATVGGGWCSSADGTNATVSGGYGNDASGDSATVGGGYTNDASNEHATVGGGWSNVASGDSATASGGWDNTASGDSATVGGGEENQATGDRSTVGGGDYNFATGHDSTISGGWRNAASGYAAAVGGGTWNEASGDFSAISGGDDNTAQGDYSFAAGRRAKANSDGCFVWGDSTFAEVVCSNANRFIARASGGVYFYTNGSLTSGVRVSAGGNAWASVSDRNLKENFAPVDGRDVLARLALIPITSWNYKSEDESIRHMGPVAQDFYAAFGLGEDDVSISTIDADGVALAAIQGLYEENVALRQQVSDLESRMAALEALVAQMAGK